MSDPAHSKEHKQWLAQVAEELGLEAGVLEAEDALLNMTASVAHGPSRPAAPITAYLIGYAAGSRGIDASEAANKLSVLAKNWRAEG